MDRQIIIILHKSFEDCTQKKDDVEFWYARDLQKLLGYDEWRNFENVINKAKAVCEKSGQEVEYHFVDVNKTIPMPKGASKEIPDVMLTRYACYLIAQNGDSRKDEIAFAMTYFAVQTRKQEIIEKRLAEIERLRAREKLSFSEKLLSGESLITGEHIKNNQNVRTALVKGGILPEALLAEEDIKKIERKIKSESKKLAKNVKRIRK